MFSFRSRYTKPNFQLAISVTWRLNDKSFSSSAELDQRLCLWKPQPFEKGWRKLYFTKNEPYERQQPNHPPEGWAGMCKSAACLGGFSLTKAPSFAIRNSDCKIHPQRRLNDKGVSPAAACDQRRCLWKLPPFEKGGRKLYFSENRCREAASRVSHQTNTRIGCRLSLPRISSSLLPFFFS